MRKHTTNNMSIECGRLVGSLGVETPISMNKMCMGFKQACRWQVAQVLRQQGKLLLVSKRSLCGCTRMVSLEGRGEVSFW